MGLKEFNVDLAKAKSTAFERVVDLRRGDCEGQLTLTYLPSNTQPPIEIEVLAQNVDSYPRKPEYLIFVSSDSTAKEIGDFLHGLSAYINTRSLYSVQQVVSTVSEKLTVKLNPNLTPAASLPLEVSDNLSNDHESEDDDSSDDGDFDWSVTDEDEDEFPIDEPITRRNYAELGQPVIDGSGAIERQKMDLLAAKMAGFSVGIVDRSASHLGAISSLSVPVRRLGITDDVLEAWDLAPPDHLILLMRTLTGYPSSDHYLKWGQNGRLVQFQLGKCSDPKPSANSCRQAFVTNQVQGHQEEKGAEQDASDFVPLYLFSFIPKLLEKDLSMLLTIRKRTGGSWIDAQEQLYNLAEAGRSPRLSGSLANPQNINNTESNADLEVPWILRQDNASNLSQNLSVPLAAMQCNLQLLVRSGKYCVNCHQQMEEGFQTMRPYVCSRDLCLEHYFSLDLGPGIEHEIIYNPYVVDLLVSFFAAAVTTHKLRFFPKGLRLKAPSFDAQRPFEASVSISGGRAILDLQTALKLGLENRFDAGERLLLVVKDDISERVLSESVWKIRLERYLCRVVYATDDGFAFDILATWRRDMSAQLPGNPADALSHFRPSLFQLNLDDDKWRQMHVLRYRGDPDDLGDAERNAALLTIVSGIPSVLKMRQYLLEHPGFRLSQSTEILDQSTYRLLFWIVASNRSFIVQDEPVKMTHPAKIEIPKSPTGTDEPKRANDLRNKVLGMGDNWMQFRFVQGSPEKERRFREAIKFTAKGDHQRRFPTLFAWHGSSLGNWHGIVSTGLNFDRIEHGRANGDGVYFSNYASTSTGYLNGYSNPNGTWAHSELNVQSAMSMCEIVNQPEEFVSQSPHYVVSNLDWIRCRFLFVQVQPTESALREPFPKPSNRPSQGYISQDPQRPLYGPGPEKPQVQIPRSAIPRSWSEEPVEVAVSPDKKGKRDGTDLEEEQRERGFEGADLDGVLGEDLPGCWKRRRVSDRPTNFRPGTLDWESIPKLPDPTSASSAAIRTLAREAKEMTKIQNSGDLPSLGWYIDFSKLTNLLGWIVELHTFDQSLPLAQDMQRKGCASIVLELRFGSNYPLTPPFVRIIRPRFLTFAEGGGGHVTAGGAICSELLTNTGWSPALSIENVLLQVRLGLCDTNPPARLDLKPSTYGSTDYGVMEAVDAYKRAARAHGWEIPKEFDTMASLWTIGAHQN